MNRRTRPSRGFTLIEIIVVVLVFSIMAALAYGGLQSVLRTKANIQASFARTAAFDRAFQRLRGDFQNVRYRPVRDTFGDEQAALTCDREGMVSVTRGGWRNPMMVSRASFERVSYKLVEKKLQRSSFRVLDQATDSKPAIATLLEGVEEVHWRFLDQDREWHTTWPADAQNMSGDSGSGDAAPPRAVELTIVTKDWGSLKFLFRSGGEVTQALMQSIRTSAAAAVAGTGAKQCPPGQKDCVQYQPPATKGNGPEPGINGGGTANGATGEGDPGSGNDDSGNGGDDSGGTTNDDGGDG